VFLKLGSAEPHGSAKGCQGFRETEVHNGGGILLAVVNFYVRIKIRVATLDSNQSLIARSQSLLQSRNFLIL